MAQGTKLPALPITWLASSQCLDGTVFDQHGPGRERIGESQYICIYVYMYICIYVYMYICIYVYMYVYICKYQVNLTNYGAPPPCLAIFDTHGNLTCETEN